MKKLNLRQIVFLSLCCDLGLFSKKIINPVANIITEALHIPGGISTAISLMFLTIAAVVMGKFGCATVMGCVQSALAVAFGMVGSMGALAPAGYILPGIAIDCVLWIAKKLNFAQIESAVLANMTAAVTASITANLLVFRLHGPILVLYLCVSGAMGATFGVVGSEVIRKVQRGISF